MDSNSTGNLGKTACPPGLVPSLVECKVTRGSWEEPVGRYVQSLAADTRLRAVVATVGTVNCAAGDLCPIAGHSLLSLITRMANYLLHQRSREGERRKKGMRMTGVRKLGTVSEKEYFKC